MNSPEQFLHQKDSKLHTSKPVEHEQARRKRRGEQTSQKPADKLASFMEVLEQTHLGHRDDPRVQDIEKKAGDEEAMEGDDDYIIAMEHGMPPISGVGLGIDRLVTILSQQDSLRDTVFFPMMRPKKDK